MSGGYQGGRMPDLKSGCAGAILALLILVAVSATLLAADAVGLLDGLLRWLS